MWQSSAPVVHLAASCRDGVPAGERHAGERQQLGRQTSGCDVVVPRISPQLRMRCNATAEGRSWLSGLPGVIRDLSARWSLSVGAAFCGNDASCAWVAEVRRADGSRAVLKVALPHFEGRDEIAGLRFWSADPTVRLLDANEAIGAMLLERCEPGTALRLLPEPEQDLVISGLLRRLWRTPPPTHAFRPISAMLTYWIDEARAEEPGHADTGLTRTALAVLPELLRPTTTDVLLATDLHAGNVLRAQREPWLVIDPKPFVGDAAYDATQHLLNCGARLASDPEAVVQRLAELLDLDAGRVRLWTFVRAAIQTDEFFGDTSKLARALAP